MLIAILIALNIKVHTIENITPYCGASSNPRYEKVACTDGVKNIWLNMLAKADLNEFLAHDTGHILFDKDKEVQDFIAKYPPPRKYPKEIYPTSIEQNQEKVADYFAMYIKYPDFPDKFPEIKELFDSKLAYIK